MKIEIATLIRLGILVITGFIAPAFKAWLSQKAEDARWSRIISWAEMAVAAAEQQYKDYAKRDPDGTRRKRFAARVLAEVLRKAGIALSEDEMTALIESAVADLNYMKTN